MPTTFIRSQYGYIFEAVLLYLTEYKPFYPENIKREQRLEIWNRWFDKHRGDVNELIDIVDNIIHTSYKECQFTESFVDRYFKVLKQLRQGIITHYEFASQVYRELMSMRSQLAIAALHDKEVELVSYD
jgi:hypothetical protein